MSKCEKKRPVGAYCPGVAAGSYCESGKCGTLSTCLTNDGKAGLGSACSVVDQCAPGLWCGGIPIQCRRPGEVGDYCPLDSSKCKAGLYCASDSKCAVPRNDGEGCFTDSGCKSGKCGKGSVCLTKEGYLPNFTGVCSSDSDCAPGNKCSGFGGRGVQCQPLSGEGESCTFDSGCKPGLKCNADSTCYDPNDPCRCEQSGTWGTLCGDWDAAGYRWCYVKDGQACKNTGRVEVTEGKGGWYKKCTGNF